MDRGRLIFVVAAFCLSAGCAPGTSPSTPSSGAATTVATIAATALASSAPSAVPSVAPTVAATAAPTTAPTSAPTAAPTTPAAPTAVRTAVPAGAIRFAVQSPDKSVNLVDLSGKSTPLGKSSVQFQPGRPWNALGNSVYALGNESKAYVVDAGGARPLTFVPATTYGFAASGDFGAPFLAWGTGTLGPTTTAEIDVSAPDGGNKKALLKENITGEPRVYRVEKFSRDGRSLYFGKEPVGLGGYILFGGLTSLWSADLATGKTSEIVAEKAAGGIICIDALSPNERMAATHCTRKDITVFTLSGNASLTALTITPPSSIQFQQIGSATFSPDNQRVAFAVARGDPDNEKGWVLVSDGLSGSSKMVAQSADKTYYTVVAWPDQDAILLQSSALSPTASGAVYVVRPDGGGLTKLADGTFLALLGGTR